jgi:hypothetical protein
VSKKPKEPDRVWPGAVEKGLQELPQYSPIVVDLRDPESQTWMNQQAAEREKGAPLTGLERRRILHGRDWRGRTRARTARPERKLPIPDPSAS